MSKIKVMLDEGAFVPVKAHAADAGFDIKSPVSKEVPAAYIAPGGRVEVGSLTIDTGVHVEIPEGYFGLLKSKSGLNFKNGITSEGVIDAGYTGSIHVKLYNHTQFTYKVEAGDKITQLVILPIHEANEMEVVDHLDETERGNGGFGSTGRK